MSTSPASPLKKAQKFVASGNLAKAESLCDKVLRQYPGQADALQLKGVIALNQHRFAAAIEAFSKALAIAPNRAANHYNLGLAYRGDNQTEQAVRHLTKATELQPGLARTYIDLCSALNALKEYERAVQAGRRALELAPQDAGAHYHLAAALHGWKDFDTSFDHYQRANELLPDNPAILFDLAQMLLGRGETDAARRYFRRVTELKPLEIEPYRQLIRINKYSSPDHEDIQRLQAREDDPSLNNDDRTAVYFSLSKAFQDCSLHDEAFKYAEKGNAIQEQLHQFNPDELADYIQAQIDFFTAERIAQLSQIGHQTTTPIFIVGTPRSGTTLTEQILFSHPDVFGAGELEWVSYCVNALPEYLKSSSSYPDCLQDITLEAAAELSSKYLTYINSLASGQDRITDKMPGNFLHLGFIHTLFPNAKIVHCQREPRDACISMFFEYFPGAVPYSYNLYKLGSYYAMYQRIMEHWHNVLPEGVIYELEYESLVMDQEIETRRLLDFLGLEWHDSCLTFYNKKRRVATASHLQVTKPMYSSSVGRWKNYEKHLQRLLEGFEYPGSF